MTYLLEIRIESMRYPESKDPANLIQHLDLKVEPGKFVSFLGRSGIGKTTLLRIMAGIERQFDGYVKLREQPVDRPTRAIQIVFQDYRLLPWKSVQENLEFAADPESLLSAQGRIDEWLGHAQLTEVRKYWPRQLSGGQVGRVAFARVFIHPPKLLLLDEPFRSVDLPTKWELQTQLVKAIEASSTTTVLVSHSIDDAAFLSDTIHVLSGPPMYIARSFDVTVARPRERFSDQLRQLSREIAEYLKGISLSEQRAIPLQR